MDRGQVSGDMSMPLDLRDYGRISGGGGSPKPPLYGLGNIDADTYLSLTAPGGVPGDVTGFYTTILFRSRSGAPGNYVMSWLTGTGGWAYIFSGSGIGFRVMNGSSVEVVSPQLAYSSDEIFGFVGVYDTAKVRLYSQGSQVMDGTSITGYTPDAGGMFVGAAGESNGFLDFFGGSYGVGIPNAANIAAWWAQTQTARRLADMPDHPSTYIWRPNSDGSNIISGASTLAKFGSGFATLAIANPQWGT